MTGTGLKGFGRATIVAAVLVLGSCAGLSFQGARRAAVDLERYGVAGWGLESIALDRAGPASTALYVGRAGGAAQGGTVRYRPAGVPTYLYRDDAGVFLPFYRIDTTDATTLHPGYGYELARPEQTIIAPNYVYVRLGDGAYAFGPVRTPSEVAQGAVTGGLSRDLRLPDLTPSVAGARVFVHPQQKQIALSDSMMPTFESRFGSRTVDPLARPLPLVVLRHTSGTVDRMEAVSFDPPVYYARLITPEGRGERLEVLLLAFPDEKTLLAALTVDRDDQGFSLADGLNVGGWAPDGRNTDGRLFDGVVDGRGRQGWGTTVFLDGRRESATYRDDVPEGIVREYAGDGLDRLGSWRGGVRNGVSLVIGLDGTPRAVERYVDGKLTSAEGYAPPIPWDGYWLGADTTPVAVSADGSAVLESFRPEGNGATVAIRLPGGLVSGRMDATGAIDGARTYERWVYTGRLSGLEPEGRGVLRFADGTTVEGVFVTGLLEGEAVVTRQGKRTLVVFRAGVTEDTGVAALFEPSAGRLSEEAYAASFAANTRAYLEAATKVMTQVQAREDAETAAAIYAGLDTIERQAASSGGSGAVLLRELAASPEYAQIRQALLVESEGTDTLRQYQFQRALDTAVQKQDFRELKTIVVRELAQDPRYAELARVMDAMGDVLISAQEQAKRLRAEEVARQRALIERAERARALGPVRPPLPLPTPPSADDQLGYLVQGAEEYYRQYKSAHEAGNAEEAEKYWTGHAAAAQNANRLYEATKE